MQRQQRWMASRLAVWTAAWLAGLALATGPGLAQPHEEQTTLDLMAFIHKVSVLDPVSATARGTLQIDTADTVRLVFGSASKTLAIDLVAPGGEVISFGDPPTAAALSGAFPDPDDPATTGVNYVFVLTDPAPGSWSYEIRETAPLTAPRAVIVNALSSSPVRAGLLGGGESYRVDRDIRLAQVAAEGSAVLESYTTNAVLTRLDPPGFPAQPVVFNDAGTDGDETAADGLFTASFQPGAPGRYEVESTLTGTTSNGEAFERTLSTVFTVHAVKATFSGTFDDRGIDLGSDGLFDQVGVAPDVEIFEPGSYNLSVVLEAAGGGSLAAHGSFTLPAGIAAPEVTFDASDLKSQLAADGPWTVAEVRLESLADGAATADAAFNLGPTAAYMLRQLQRKPIEFLAGGSAAGRDTNGNGRFELLDVTLPVDVLTAGFYQWSARLVDRNSTEVALASGSALLGGGPADLSLTFNGRAIGENGVDGPYFVRNLIVFGVGESLIVDDPLTTQAFTASQFEGFVEDQEPPKLTVTAQPDVLWPPNHEMVEIAVEIQVTDNTDPDPLVRLESITSNEGDNAIGDGNTSDDIRIGPQGSISLRAERSGTGDGRVYTLTYSARDAAGNVAFATTTVSVPKSQGQGN